MNYESLAFLLMVIGFALIAAEIFIPSGGMIMILCVIAFSASIWFAYKAWWEAAPVYFWTFIGSLVLLIPGTIIGTFRMLERTSLGKRILLAAPDPESVTPYQEETAHLNELIGSRGEALTLMTPSGMVRVQGERLHAFSEGLVIQAGEAVEIIGVRGTRVLVRPVAQDSALTESATGKGSDSPRESHETGTSEDESAVDFDFPAE